MILTHVKSYCIFIFTVSFLTCKQLCSCFIIHPPARMPYSLSPHVHSALLVALAGVPVGEGRPLQHFMVRKQPNHSCYLGLPAVSLTRFTGHGKTNFYSR